MNFFKKVDKLPNFLFLILLMVIVVVIYGQTYSYDFFAVDDLFHIKHKAHFNPTTISSIFSLWKESLMPVPYTLWGFIALIFGSQDPMPFHVLNIGLYFMSCIIFYFVIKNLLNFRYKNDEKLIKWASFIGTLLFTLHPLHVEIVAWISGLKDISMLILILLAILTYTQFRIKGLILLLFTTIVFIILAILSKFSAITMLPILFLLDLYWFKIKDFKKYIWYIASCVIALIYAIYYYSMYNTAFKNYSIFEKAVLVVKSIIIYFSKLLLPFSLSFDYGLTPENMLYQFGLGIEYKLILLVGIVLLLLVFILKLFKKIDLIFLFLLLITISLITNAGFAQYNFQFISIVADRYTLLASIFFCFGLSVSIVFCSKTQPDYYPKIIIPIVSLVLITFYTINTFLYVPTWKNSESIFKNAIEVNPDSYISNYTLSLFLWADRKHKESLKYLLSAIIIKPTETTAFLEFLNRHAALGRIDEFEESYLNYLKPYYIGHKYFLDYLVRYCNSSNVKFKHEEEREQIVEFLKKHI